jgi:hypothetical protein
MDRREVTKILKRVADATSTPERMERISEYFLGRPYQIEPLIGSATTPEVFVASLDAFDCVTYMETVLSLADAKTAEDFERRLRNIRYAGGVVRWTKRNHYMIDWIRHNVREVAMGLRPIAKKRTLNVVPGLAPRVRRFRCFPKRTHSRLQSGDLIFFASTRPHLDIFHCGLIVKKEGRTLLRHASRSQGGVVEQTLSDFLQKNRMSGIIVARP